MPKREEEKGWIGNPRNLIQILIFIYILIISIIFIMKIENKSYIRTHVMEFSWNALDVKQKSWVYALEELYTKLPNLNALKNLRNPSHPHCKTLCSLVNTQSHVKVSKSITIGIFGLFHSKSWIIGVHVRLSLGFSNQCNKSIHKFEP